MSASSAVFWCFFFFGEVGAPEDQKRRLGKSKNGLFVSRVDGCREFRKGGVDDSRLKSTKKACVAGGDGVESDWTLQGAPHVTHPADDFD